MTETQLNSQRSRIASILKSRREYLQLTEQQVSDKTDGKLSHRTIQRAESGIAWLGLKQLILICNALEWDVADIFEQLNEK